MQQKLFVFMFLCLLSISNGLAQELPKYLTEEEKTLMPAYLQEVSADTRNSSLPPDFPVRNMAEWEESEYLYITWRAYPAILKEIVRFGRESAKVVVLCNTANDTVSARNYLINNQVDLENVYFKITPTNSVWIRDYFTNTAYKNDVDSLILVDWVYNRPRPADNNVALHVAQDLDLPLYRTNLMPNRLIHTGGNYMSNGNGQAFSSELILDENPSLSEAQVDQIMEDFLGITEYIKMTNLPYDGIHHIDMHMKILDEETLIVGEYPAGISDGPQIEANILYVVENFQNHFEEDFSVIRIPMPPPPFTNFWPSNNGPYRTYANMKIINNTILVPVYNIPQDEEALDIIRAAKPGYNVVGINVNGMINAGGAIHCITHSVGVQKPLLITHKKLKDKAFNEEGYQVSATIKHIDGIANAKLYYTNDTTQAYEWIEMLSQESNIYSASIPAYNEGDEIFYYIEAEANSGKIQKRPITAPEGYYQFNIYNPLNILDVSSFFETRPLFPNPAKAITCLPYNFTAEGLVSLKIYDSKGALIETVFEGRVNRGEKNFFINAEHYQNGIYLVELSTEFGLSTQKLIIEK
jgi:agmatine deiminase